MKKIAVPVEGSKVSVHFGHAPEFKLYNIEGKKISNEIVIENPGHKPGLLPKLLSEKGADLIIASGMGQKAISIFEDNNIKVICGVTGEAETAVKNYLAGNLNTASNACSHDEKENDH